MRVSTYGHFWRRLGSYPVLEVSEVGAAGAPEGVLCLGSICCGQRFGGNGGIGDS